MIRPTLRHSIACLIVLAATGSLAACSGSDSPDQAGDSNKLQRLVFINPAPAQPAWKGAEACFLDAAKKAGIDAKVYGTPGASTSTADQLRFIEQAVSEGADGILGTSFTGDTALEAAFQSARDKDVLVGTMASGDATKARNFDIGIDIVKFGQDMADQVALRPGEHRVAIVLPGLTGTPKIFQESFAAQAKTHDNVEIAQAVSDDGNVTKDADLVNSLLTANPDITDVVAVNPGSTAGIVTAIAERNKIGEVFMLGNGLADPAPAALENGTAAAFYVQKKCDLGKVAVEKMVALSQGKDVPRNVAVATVFATQDNVKSLDPKVWN